MNKLIISIFTFFIMLSLHAQDKQPYQLYNKEGKKTNFKKLIKKAKEYDVVLFGELHNNAISHWLQYELIADLSKKEKLVLGFEMLERDQTEVLQRYMKSEIDQKKLDSLTKMWHNYKTDYKPLVDFGKKNNIKVVATNIPRYLANKVFKSGFDGLNNVTEQEKKWMAPLPIPYDASLPGYVEMMQMMGGHGGENLPKAQAMKDATMAFFIIENLKSKSVFVHFNGAYHSNNFEGIYWYLKKYKPELKILTITTETVGNVKKFNPNFKNKADFIIQVDENMTNTY